MKKAVMHVIGMVLILVMSVKAYASEVILETNLISNQIEQDRSFDNTSIMIIVIIFIVILAGGLYALYREFGQVDKKQPEGVNKKEKLFEKLLSQRSPSDLFASGTVFDISKFVRPDYLEALRSNNVMDLKQIFVKSFMLLMQHPEQVGLMPQMVNRNAIDTNPAEWNADILDLSNGAYAALLFMPVRNSNISARIVGIIFSDRGDGYYYCMLNNNAEMASTVYRNNAMMGIKKVGEVKGLGFELMNNFIDCIKSDYYAKPVEDSEKNTVKMGKQIRRCSLCGMELTEGVTFCVRCGMSIKNEDRLIR